MDYGSTYTERREKILTLRLQKVYREAQKDLEEGFEAFLKKHRKKGEEMLNKLANGDITQDEYASWMRGQVFQGKRWQASIDQATDTLRQANEIALTMVRNEQRVVYAENANIEACKMENDFDASFSIYDESTVDRLIRGKPELMPRKVLNGRKDRAWNQGVISNAVSQAVIQGESIPKLAKRLAHDVSSTDMKAMTRYARTAMTAAQNAGRIDTLNRATAMGIEVKKQWLATLDKRTRDSHRYLDGQTQDVNKPFHSELGKIMYPGDPNADDQCDVWNCRCTLIYVYPKYSKYEKDWRKEEEIDGQTYQKWKEDKKKEPNKSAPKGKEQKTDVSSIPTLQTYNEAVGWAKEKFELEIEELRTGWAKVDSQIEAFDQFEEEIPEYIKSISEAIEKNEFASRTSAKNVYDILESGRFKSQIESGHSNGVLDIDKRKSVANQLFAYGEELNIKNNEYEIYGYLDNSPRAGMYGNCRIVFKKENLIDRTTFTVGDSLEMYEAGADPFATLVNKPDIVSYGTRQFSDSVPNAPQRLKEIQRDFGSLKENGYLSDGNYLELQFHGGVTINDIEYIQVSKSDAKASEIEKIANEKGVKIKWMP